MELNMKYHLQKKCYHILLPPCHHLWPLFPFSLASFFSQMTFPLFFFSALIPRTVWSLLLMAALWSWMVDPSARSTSTPGRALCVAAVVSISRVAASLLSVASSTPSTLCVPSVCVSCAKESSRSRMGSHTAHLAFKNSLWGNKGFHFLGTQWPSEVQYLAFLTRLEFNYILSVTWSVIIIWLHVCKNIKGKCWHQRQNTKKTAIPYLHMWSLNRSTMCCWHLG